MHFVGANCVRPWAILESPLQVFRKLPTERIKKRTWKSVTTRGLFLMGGGSNESLHRWRGPPPFNKGGFSPRQFVNRPYRFFANFQLRELESGRGSPPLRVVCFSCASGTENYISAISPPVISLRKCRSPRQRGQNWICTAFLICGVFRNGQDRSLRLRELIFSRRERTLSVPSGGLPRPRANAVRPYRFEPIFNREDKKGQPQGLPLSYSLF